MNKSTLIIGLCVAFVLGIVCGCSSPAKVEIVPDKVVLEGPGAKLKLAAKVYDGDGEEIPDGLEIVWFSEDLKIITLSHDGEVEAVSSGEAKVEVEVVGTELKSEVPIRVKIPASVNVSHEKLRLWTGQVKENVWAEVRSEKDAFIEGYFPEWRSDDSTIVKVEPIKDSARRQSWVKMTGMKSGTTYINASFRGISKTIRVAVYDDDEEVALDGTRIPKEENGEAEEKEGAKKEKQKK